MPLPFAFGNGTNANGTNVSLRRRAASQADNLSTASSNSSEASPPHCAPRLLPLPRPIPLPRPLLNRNASRHTHAHTTVHVRPDTAASSSPLLSSSSSSSSPRAHTYSETSYTELVVLVHGLQGAVADFSTLLEELAAARPTREGAVLVHASSVNTDRTYDGIVPGGRRLAADIRSVIRKHSSLQRISLLGFSLGGLYARYAAAVLFDHRSNTIAGLQPNVIATVASPNLGVRNFGVYRFFPPQLLSKAHLLFGTTGLEIVMEDTHRDESILVAMTRDVTHDGDPAETAGLLFLSALRAFPRRYLYANVRNDFMVNYGTAALDPSVQVVSGTDVLGVVNTPANRDVVDVDADYDDKGCKVCFTFEYPPEETEKEQSSPVRVTDAPADEPFLEAIMARRLQAVGWTVVAVDFPLAMPIAHNRIVAMSRGPIHTWLNAAGKRVVHHLVDTLMQSFDDAERKFSRVESAAVPRRSLSMHAFRAFNLDRSAEVTARAE